MIDAVLTDLSVVFKQIELEEVLELSYIEPVLRELIDNTNWDENMSNIIVLFTGGMHSDPPETVRDRV